MLYVLIYEPSSALEIHGPFDTKQAATEFGTDWQVSNDDCPCWQVIEKPEVKFMFG